MNKNILITLVYMETNSNSATISQDLIELVNTIDKLVEKYGIKDGEYKSLVEQIQKTEQKVSKIINNPYPYKLSLKNLVQKILTDTYIEIIESEYIVCNTCELLKTWITLVLGYIDDFIIENMTSYINVNELSNISYSAFELAYNMHTEALKLSKIPKKERSNIKTLIHDCMEEPILALNKCFEFTINAGERSINYRTNT